MEEIELTHGLLAFVDSIDFDLVKNIKWHAKLKGHKYYAEACVWENGRPKTIKMHRLITGAKEGELVDHINHDGLDNKQQNLRICDYFENNRHKRSFKKKYQGVSRTSDASTWRAAITVDGKQMHLGCFKTPEEAAQAYNNAAIKHHGEFASLNILEGT